MRNKFLILDSLNVRLWGLWAPWLKPIICINILIPEPFLTQFLTFFSFKCPYTYTLDIFSYLFNTCRREWSKLIIKTIMVKIVIICVLDINGPFGASQFWFQKFITKSKLIQSIICKRHQVSSHLKYSQKLTSKFFFQNVDSFHAPNKKKSFMWHSWKFFFVIHSFFASKHIFL